MKTFRQVMDAFLTGATSGIEGAQDQPLPKLAIYGNTLIWITEKRAHPLAIRLSDDLILKNMDWDIVSDIPGFKHFMRICKANNIHITRDELVSLPKHHDILVQIAALETTAGTAIGEQLLCKTNKELDNKPPLIAYKKKYGVEKQTAANFNTLNTSIQIYNYLRQNGIQGYQQNPIQGLIPHNIKAIINNINSSQQILRQLTEYLQVCITLPEISSPGITIGRDEQPGGEDSRPSISQEQEI
ncbi:MAG: hypothetical protein HF975_04295 [ANME-2 cluster archaeon]|nr:hypothetical protein [ANME-2 cluster archaeon]